MHIILVQVMLCTFFFFCCLNIVKENYLWWFEDRLRSIMVYLHFASLLLNITRCYSLTISLLVQAIANACKVPATYNSELTESETCDEYEQQFSEDQELEQLINGDICFKVYPFLSGMTLPLGWIKSDCLKCFKMLSRKFWQKELMYEISSLYERDITCINKFWKNKSDI